MEGKPVAQESGPKKKAKGKYTPRSSLGFHLLRVEGSEAGVVSYIETGAPPQKSLNNAIKYIRDNAEKFGAQKIMVAHLKKEVNVTVVVETVAKIT